MATAAESKLQNNQATLATIGDQYRELDRQRNELQRKITFTRDTTEAAALRAQRDVIDTQLNKFDNDIDTLQVENSDLRNQIQAQVQAAGPTAEQKLQTTNTADNPGTGSANTTQDPQPITADQKQTVDQANSGELSNKVQQSQDPTAASNTRSS